MAFIYARWSQFWHLYEPSNGPSCKPCAAEAREMGEGQAVDNGEARHEGAKQSKYKYMYAKSRGNTNK